MAQTFRLLYRQCNILQLTKPVPRNNSIVRILSNRVCYSNSNLALSTWISNIRQSQQLKRVTIRQCASVSNPPTSEPKKKGIIQKFKEMYRDYWYVLVPVHLATSAVWLGAFYYSVRSGVDVLGLLESLGISEKLMEPLRNSGAGYYALTFALYKIFAPVRYAVTLGGTTFTINKLKTLGWIKPVPSGERIKEMIKEKKDRYHDRKGSQ